jgi:TonB family protein
MFEESATTEDIVTKKTVQKTPRTITKKTQKNQIKPSEEIAPGTYSVTRPDAPENNSSARVSVTGPTTPVPSFSQINALFNPPPKSGTMSKEMRDLYGDSIREFSKDQLEFLDHNLNRIGIITQKYLSFPTLAGNMGMQGETILEFDLYPNGDISAIKRLRSSGYALLDDNAVETVEVAYKEYPNPKEMTRIRLLVKYINDYAR